MLRSNIEAIKILRRRLRYNQFPFLPSQEHYHHSTRSSSRKSSNNNNDRNQRDGKNYSRSYSGYNNHDRIRMLRQQQIDIERMFHYEQVLGLQHQRRSVVLAAANTTNDSDLKKDIECNNNDYNYTLKELHTAYINAAKRCHPDAQQYHYNNNSNNNDSTYTSTNSTTTTAEEKFILVTNAYEFLKEQLMKTGAATLTNDSSTTIEFEEEQQEEYYRQECYNVLGQPAEIVEESKRCPLFRQWLFGRTDAAYYWQSFFMLHGGLAPFPLRQKRNGKLLLLSENSSTSNFETTAIPKNQSIRRRRRH